eukprot:scaffold73938_cov36-Phaeocystis_antarctica.AAC.3
MVRTTDARKSRSLPGRIADAQSTDTVEPGSRVSLIESSLGVRFSLICSASWLSLRRMRSKVLSNLVLSLSVPSVAAGGGDAAAQQAEPRRCDGPDLGEDEGEVWGVKVRLKVQRLPTHVAGVDSHGGRVLLDRAACRRGALHSVEVARTAHVPIWSPHGVQSEETTPPPKTGSRLQSTTALDEGLIQVHLEARPESARPVHMQAVHRTPLYTLVGVQRAGLGAEDVLHPVVQTMSRQHLMGLSQHRRLARLLPLGQRRCGMGLARRARPYADRLHLGGRLEDGIGQQSGAQHERTLPETAHVIRLRLGVDATCGHACPSDAL